MILAPLSMGYRPSPIMGYVGPNGSGKTAMAVHDALKLSRGKTLVSNIMINPPAENNTEFIRLTSLSQLAWIEDRKTADGDYYYDDHGYPARDLKTLKNAHILIDEAQFVFNSRDTLSVPREIQGLLASLRHHQLTFSWTTPTLGQMDLQIRRVTQTVLATKPVPLFSKYIPGEYWPRTRVSIGNQYDLTSAVVEDIDEFTPKIHNGWLLMRSLNLDAYDSFEDVQLITDHLECEYCGLPHRKQYASHPVGEHPVFKK